MLEEEEFAIQQMNINFDGHIGQNGKPLEITGDIYIQIYAKYLA